MAAGAETGRTMLLQMKLLNKGSVFLDRFQFYFYSFVQSNLQTTQNFLTCICDPKSEINMFETSRQV